jgi:hypothetical protein
MVAPHGLRCLFCGQHNTDTVVHGNTTITTCHDCAGMVRVELNPADDPDLAGRIECLREPHTAEGGRAVRKRAGKGQADPD